MRCVFFLSTVLGNFENINEYGYPINEYGYPINEYGYPYPYSFMYSKFPSTDFGENH